MNKIFIQIASFRDDDLINTIDSCVNNSKYPNNLSFGICIQDDKNYIYNEIIKRKYRMFHIPWEESKGVCYARSITQKLYDNEEYSLQIDSHMRFRKNWDETLIMMLDKCKSNHPILGGYVPSFEEMYKEEYTYPYYLGASNFNKRKILLVSPNAQMIDKYVPQKGYLIGAHFMFSTGDINNIKYDPSLYFIGEEVSMSVRYFTNGYDVFYPNITTCYHNYERKGQYKSWEMDKNKWVGRDICSQLRVRNMLGCGKNSYNYGIYGLGNERTLTEFEKLSEIDFKKQTFSERARLGIYE